MCSTPHHSGFSGKMPIAKNTPQVRRRETQHFATQAVANPPKLRPPDSYQRIGVLCFTVLTGNAV